MHIVSYRGPSEAGGVSKLLQQGLKGERQPKWWHINRNFLQVRESDKFKRKTSIPAEIIDGHYNYANEFLWPLMHERFDLVRYDKSAHDSYVALNLAVAGNLLNELEAADQVFTNDYQFAILPLFLNNRPTKNIHFWHIPWPTTCLQSMAEPLIQIADGLLHNQKVGFHTTQYVQNFCNFVEEFMPAAKVHYTGESAYIKTKAGFTELIVNPAQIEYHRWNRLGRRSEAAQPEVPYILSVDRADYSKGVLERLEAIRIFFQTRPEQREKIQFVFICQQTRKGIDSFDNYWSECIRLYESISEQFRTDCWAPIKWIQEPLAMEDLASWYAHAKAMLINPRVDGLNLTAKEFVAATTNPEAALLLTRGTGAWVELKEHAITIDGHQAKEIAEALFTLIETRDENHRMQLRELKRILRKNTLESWWKNLTSDPAPQQQSALAKPILINSA